MKRLAILLTIALLLASLGGCGKGLDAPEGVRFTDDLGRTVTVSDTGRVAALLGSFADLWMLAGGSVCATADDAWEDLNLPLEPDTVNLGSTHRPDREALIASAPTFVLASSQLTRHLELQEPLEALGIPVAYFDVGDFQDYLRVMKLLTELLNTPQNYQTYAAAQEQRINALLEQYRQEEPQTVLVMRASAASIRAKNSDGTVLGGMLRDFGCINIADSNAMLLEELSLEAILLQNPDKLFFIETGDEAGAVREAVEQMFRENPLWYQLDAVKNGRVYYMEKQLYNLKPNARFAEAYEKLGEILYEE